MSVRLPLVAAACLVAGGVEARPRQPPLPRAPTVIAPEAPTPRPLPESVEVRVLRFGEQSRVVLAGDRFVVDTQGARVEGALPPSLRREIVVAARASVASGGVGRSCAPGEPFLAITLDGATTSSGLCTEREEIAPWRVLLALLQRLPALAGRPPTRTP